MKRQVTYVEISSKVPAKYKDQKPILFRRVESEPMNHESSNDGLDSPQLFHYAQKSHWIMEIIGYDLIKRYSLNFSKGRRILLRSFVPKRKAPDYYNKTWRELGYVSSPVSSDCEPEEWVSYDHSSGISSWESDVRIGTIFNSLSVNMISSNVQKMKMKKRLKKWSSQTLILRSNT